MSTVPARNGKDIGKPAWDIAKLYPAQGFWDEDDYLALNTNWRVEFDDGSIEVLPMPTTAHQLTVLFLYRMLFAFVSSRKLGTVLAAPLPMRTLKTKYREPDVLFLFAKHQARRGNRFWQGADLVMEVVSKGKKERRRDLVLKRKEYAATGIPEYWIVDPLKSEVVVLQLSNGQYVVAGRYGSGQKVKSVLLRGFEVDVDAALAGE
jgi:Uma2 family endonuclease